MLKTEHREREREREIEHETKSVFRLNGRGWGTAEQIHLVDWSEHVCLLTVDMLKIVPRKKMSKTSAQRKPHIVQRECVLHMDEF